MKKKLLLIFLLFLLIFVKSGFSQTYDSLVIEGAHWIIKGDDATTPWIDTCYGYKIEGDTVFNSLNYKKVYRLFFHADHNGYDPVWHFPLKIESKTLFAFVREKNKLIYAVLFGEDYFGCNTCSFNEEIKLYDFNYSIGDTVHQCSALDTPHVSPDHIIGITSNGYLNHKVFKTMKGTYYFEGIGSNYGLFECAYSFVSGGVMPFLSNYCIGSDSECNMIILSDFLVPTSKKFIIYPNPTSKFFSLELFVNYNPVCLQIISQFGQCVFETNISNSIKKLDISTFQSGLYFVKVSMTSSEVFYNKLIINNP